MAKHGNSYELTLVALTRHMLIRLHPQLVADTKDISLGSSAWRGGISDGDHSLVR